MLTTDPQTEQEQEPNEPPASQSAGADRVRGLLSNRTLRVALQTVVVLVVLTFVILNLAEEWPAIVKYENWRFEPLFLIAGIAMLIVRGPIICLGWRLIVKRMGYALSWRRAIRIYFYSGMAKYVPGNVWYAVGRVLLAQQVGVPKMITSVSIALETALVVVASILVSALSLTVRPQAEAYYLIFVLVGLLIFLAWPQPWFALMNRALVLLGRNPATIKISGADLLILLPPFMLNWAAYGFISFCWTASLYPQLPWSEWPAITGLFTLAWVAGFLAILVPNGWGIREGLTVLFLTSQLGIDLPVALGAALLSRLGSILGEAAWAFIAWQIKVKD